jgi:hypothetical protein
LKLFVSVLRSSELASRATPRCRFPSTGEKTGLIGLLPARFVSGFDPLRHKSLADIGRAGRADSRRGSSTAFVIENRNRDAIEILEIGTTSASSSVLGITTCVFKGESSLA